MAFVKLKGAHTFMLDTYTLARVIYFKFSL